MSTPPHSHDLDEVATIPVLRGPGEQLRSAREAAGRSVHEISTHMHLDSRVIQALEADDYDQLPAPTFVRGYLRGYARLLDLAPDPIVRAFEQRDLAPPSLVADISVKSRIHGGDFPIRVVTYVVIAALVVLVVLWWRSQEFAPVRFDSAFSEDSEDSAMSEEESASLPQDVPEAETEPLSAPRQAREPESDIEEGTAAPLETEPSLSSEAPEPALRSTEVDTRGVASTATDSDSAPSPESESPVGETPAPAADAEPAADRESGTEVVAAMDEATTFALSTGSAGETSGNVAETAPEIAGGGTSAPEANAEESVQEASSESPEPAEGAEPSAASTPPTLSPPEGTSRVAGAPLDRLEMSFSVECWLEVYDHAEERLFYGLAQAGEQLSLSGRGPIRVVLGNSDGVEVRYNGTPIEFASFTTRGVARFSVGGSPPQVSPTPPSDADTASETRPTGENESEPGQDGEGESAPAGG